MKKRLMMLNAGGKSGLAISPSAFVLKGKYGHFPKLNKLTKAAVQKKVEIFLLLLCVIYV